MTRAVELAQIASTGVTEAFKNRMINGAMTIAQRGTSFTGITSGNNRQFAVDRFNVTNQDNTSVYSGAQVVDAPPGFVHSIRAQVTTINATPNSESYIEQVIEGFNCAGLAYGTASAVPVTLSFWVKVSIVGTYNVWMFSASSAKAIGSSFSVTSANTWQFVSMTFAGDTASALASDNGHGIYVRWYLDVNNAAIGALPSTWSTNVTPRMVSGSVRFASTLNATYQLTGVQFEAGSSASSFEYRPYSTELQLCQRYFEILAPAAIMLPWSSAAQITRVSVPFQVTKRAAPTIDMRTKGGGTGTMGAAGSSVSGVTYFGSGGANDVIEYPSPTASIELV